MIPSPDVMPCGCVIMYGIIDGTKTATVSPCSEDCEWINDQLEQATRSGIPINHRNAP